MSGTGSGLCPLPLHSALGWSNRGGGALPSRGGHASCLPQMRSEDARGGLLPAGRPLLCPLHSRPQCRCHRWGSGFVPAPEAQNCRANR